MPNEPASPHVRRKREARRDRIVDAAFDAIAESGPADFSLNQLARDLEYTPGALYWYFRSKEALVVEVQCRAFGSLAQWLGQGREQWSRAPALRRCSEPTRQLYVLLELARFYLNLHRTRPRYARLIGFSLDPRVWLDDGSAPKLGPVLTELFQEVAVPFHQAQQSKALGEGNAVARAVQYWAALQGLLQTSKLARLAPNLFDAERLGMDSAETLLRGWGASARNLRSAREKLSASQDEN